MTVSVGMAIGWFPIRVSMADVADLARCQMRGHFSSKSSPALKFNVKKLGKGVTVIQTRKPHAPKMQIDNANHNYAEPTSLIGYVSSGSALYRSHILSTCNILRLIFKLKNHSDCVRSSGRQASQTNRVCVQANSQNLVTV